MQNVRSQTPINPEDANRIASGLIKITDDQLIGICSRAGKPVAQFRQHLAEQARTLLGGEPNETSFTPFTQEDVATLAALEPQVYWPVANVVGIDAKTFRDFVTTVEVPKSRSTSAR